jgi:hypothetical protein
VAEDPSDFLPLSRVRLLEGWQSGWDGSDMGRYLGLQNLYGRVISQSIGNFMRSKKKYILLGVKKAKVSLKPYRSGIIYK